MLYVPNRDFRLSCAAWTFRSNQRTQIVRSFLDRYGADCARITDNLEVGLFGVKLTRNAPPVDVASGSCPEVRFWSITEFGRYCCGTCPRSRFLGSFTDHFDGLPTSRSCGLGSGLPTTLKTGLMTQDKSASRLISTSWTSNVLWL